VAASATAIATSSSRTTGEGDAAAPKWGSEPGLAGGLASTATASTGRPDVRDGPLTAQLTEAAIVTDIKPMARSRDGIWRAWRDKAMAHGTAGTRVLYDYEHDE
jgi:hypothetical protein